MTYKNVPLVVPSDANTLKKNQKRISSKYNQNITIGAAGAAVVLPEAYPIGFNTSTGKHAPWMAPDPSILTVDINDRTGGTWGITVNSLVIANTAIAWNATAAVVTELLRINGYNVTVDLTTKVYTITFDDPTEITTIPSTLSGDVTQLTGGTGATAVETEGASTNGTDRVRGFIHPNDSQTGITAGSSITDGAVVLTGTDTLCTVTTLNPHGLASTMSLTFSGADEAKLNITATITVLTEHTFTYAVAAVSGGTVDSVSYTTTNDQITVMMVKGEIAFGDITPLVAAADVTALQTALRADLIPDGFIIQGLTQQH